VLGDGLFIGFLSRTVIALVREHLIHGNSMQPSAKCAATLERLQIAPSPNESELDAVFGNVRVPSHPQTQSIHPCAMHAIQTLERLHIPTPRRRDEMRIRHGLSFDVHDRIVPRHT
jgi:hypothetical protein